MKKVLRKIAEMVLRPFPADRIGRIAVLIVSTAIKGATPKEALKTLLNMDNYIYGVTGHIAVRYGDGNHVKHRLTGYVEYFVELAISVGGPYLDIGCAQGAISGELANRTTQKVVGIDQNGEAIDEAKKRFKQSNLEFIEADATTMEVSEEFNTIILSNVLEHIDKRVEFLLRLKRIYNPRHWLVRIPNYERDWRVPLKKELNIAYFSDPTHCIEHTPSQFEEEVIGAGLTIKEVEYRWGEIWAVLNS